MAKKNSMSLAVLLKEDEDFVRRIKEVAVSIEKDTKKIQTFAQKYNQRYEKEIAEGTIKKHLLLEDGARKGLTVDEVEKSSGFIPTVYTPILNWLYFFMKEENYYEDVDYKREKNREVQEKMYSDENIRRLLMESGKDIKSVEKAPEMEEYVYGNLTLEKFQTLKKLKRLSKSPNEHEAFAAYRKCLEMCKEHKIDFDKIPD